MYRSGETAVPQKPRPRSAPSIALSLALLCGAPACSGDIAGGPTAPAPRRPPRATPSTEVTPPGVTPPFDPGRVTLRRLNRAEYDNTVRHLLGTALRPGESLPKESAERGFSNNADELTISPLTLELLARGAEALAEEAALDAVLASMPEVIADEVRRQRALPAAA